MTITYPNGTVLEAIMLSHEENEIRAIAAGCGDVLAFTRIHGTWISEKDSCRLMPSAQSEPHHAARRYSQIQQRHLQRSELVP
jgi:hypothetical protein